jgi:hypothetical protein
MIRRVERNLGKLLFPHSQSWKQQQKVRVIFAILLLELAIAGVIVGLALLNGLKLK